MSGQIRSVFRLVGTVAAIEMIVHPDKSLLGRS